jgi:HAD superfamily hydrolase (TIGR01490 family)
MSAKPPVEPHPYIAFFDVDETLIDVKSMFDFLRFYWQRLYPADQGRRYRRTVSLIQLLARLGVSRAVINRLYYRLYRGRPRAEVEAAGRDWFAARATEPSFFIEPAVAELRRHRHAGARIVLVSGSFPACLDPIAEALGASDVLCTRMAERDGVFTGAIEQPCIGLGKRRALERFLASHPKIDPSDCYAYGDHVSDVPMLTAVGNPVVVGGGDELLRHARELAWRVM